MDESSTKRLKFQTSNFGKMCRRAPNRMWGTICLTFARIVEVPEARQRLEMLQNLKSGRLINPKIWYKWVLIKVSTIDTYHKPRIQLIITCLSTGLHVLYVLFNVKLGMSNNMPRLVHHGRNVRSAVAPKLNWDDHCFCQAATRFMVPITLGYGCLW